MPSTGDRAGEPNVGPTIVSFRAELEHQILAIHDAFCAFITDDWERRGAIERQKQDAEDRLREAERRIKNLEDRLCTSENQKQDLERQLRKLQKTWWVRVTRFLKRSNPFRSIRDESSDAKSQVLRAFPVVQNPPCQKRKLLLGVVYQRRILGPGFHDLVTNTDDRIKQAGLRPLGRRQLFQEFGLLSSRSVPRILGTARMSNQQTSVSNGNPSYGICMVVEHRVDSPPIDVSL